MLSSPPPSGSMTAYSLAQWSRARALNDPDLSPTRPTSGSKSTPVAATTTHAQSIRAALRRADDIYFAACQRDWELYAVGASLARFLDSTRDQTDWFQLGARSQFDKCLAKGKAMSRDQLMRGLALPYDPCDALVGFACQSGRTFTADPSMRNHDFFGFRAPPYAVLQDGHHTPSSASSENRPEFPFSRVEAGQIFSVHAGPGAFQTLQADFPGHIHLSLSRMNVSPHAATGSDCIDLDAGHVFEPNQIALDLVWIDPQHFLGVMGDPDSPDDDGQPCTESTWSERLSQFTTQLESSFYSHPQIKRLAQLASTSSTTDSGNADQTLPPRTDSALLTDHPQSDDPTLDPATHAALRTRCAQYLTVLTAPRARLRVPLSLLAKVSLVNDGASTRLGRGVLILELSHPVELVSQETGGSEWPDAQEWSASPRVYIYGYFSELYAVLRRLVFLVPAMEGVVYRGDVEELRNTEYHVQFPNEVTFEDTGVGEWTMESLEAMSVSDLWALAEVCGIRKLVPRDADAFTIAEHLIVYARVIEGANGQNAAGVSKDDYAGNRELEWTQAGEKEHVGGVIRKRLPARGSSDGGGLLDAQAALRGEQGYDGLIPAAVPAGIMEAAVATQEQAQGTDVAARESQKSWSPTKTMMFIVAMALLFRQFVSFLIASTVRKAN